MTNDLVTRLRDLTVKVLLLARLEKHYGQTPH
jgi:hypothetical protein